MPVGGDPRIDALNSALYHLQPPQTPYSTPFTYNNGLTMLEIIERIRQAVIDTITYAESFGKEVTALVGKINAAFDKWAADSKKKLDDFEAFLNDSRVSTEAKIKSMNDLIEDFKKRLISAEFKPTEDGNYIEAPLMGGGKIRLGTAKYLDNIVEQIKADVARQMREFNEAVDKKIKENLESGFDIVFVFGQSNAAGSGYPVTDLDRGDNRILCYYSDGNTAIDETINVAIDPLTAGYSESYGVGPAISFCKRMIMNGALPAPRKYMIVNLAWGGAPVTALNNELPNSIATLRNALNMLPSGQTHRISHMLFVQGEAEAAGSPDGNAWKTGVNAIISRVKSDIPQSKDMVTILGSISPRWANIAPGGQTIRQAAKDLARSRSDTLWCPGPMGCEQDPDGLGGSRVGIHYSARGARDLGAVMAEMACGNVPAPMPGVTHNGEIIFDTPDGVEVSEIYSGGTTTQGSSGTQARGALGVAYVRHRVGGKWSKWSAGVKYCTHERRALFILNPQGCSNFHGYPMNGWGGEGTGAEKRVHSLDGHSIPIMDRAMLGGSCRFRGKDGLEISATNDWTLNHATSSAFMGSDGYSFFIVVTADITDNYQENGENILGWRSQSKNFCRLWVVNGNTINFEGFATDGSDSKVTTTFLPGAPNVIMCRQNTSGVQINCNGSIVTKACNGLNSGTAPLILGDGFFNAGGAVYGGWKGTIDYMAWFKSDLDSNAIMEMMTYLNRRYRVRRQPELRGI